MKTFSLDTEFRASSEQHIQPVCAVIRDMEETTRYWMTDPHEKERFLHDFRFKITFGYKCIVYYASAEARFLQALGMPVKEILEVPFLDPYLLHRALWNTNPKYRYGIIYEIIDGTPHKHITTPPPINEPEDGEWVENEDGELKPHHNFKHTRIGHSLAAVCGALLDVCIDTEHKQNVRDLILETDDYSKSQQETILKYCEDDTQYLLPIAQKLLKAAKEDTQNFSIANWIQLSSWSAACGIIESHGIPIDVEKMDEFASHNLYLKDRSIRRCNETQSFWALEKKEWKERESLFTDYINSIPARTTWPKTDKGKYKKDGDTRKIYDGYPAIKILHETKTIITQLRYFQPKAYGNIKKNIGSDNRIRVLMSPYATLTGRNAPSVKAGWIFAMTTALRPLVSASPGRVIIGADWSAQEVALQAWLSKDEAFMEAYKSGDPYTWLADQTGELAGVVRKQGKFYIGNDLHPDQKHCRDIRQLYKALFLGIGYGMGIDKLAIKLTASRFASLSEDKRAILHQASIQKDPGLMVKAEAIMEEITIVPGNKPEDRLFPKEQQAIYYRDLYKTIFAKYWSWRQDKIKEYNKYNSLVLEDGWFLASGCRHATTITNFPVQAMGALLLREATKEALKKDLPVMCTFHDAIYLESLKEKAEIDKTILVDCMSSTVKKYCDEPFIRVDVDTYDTDWSKGESKWCKDKGGDTFKWWYKYFTKSDLDLEVKNVGTYSSRRFELELAGAYSEWGPA